MINQAQPYHIVEYSYWPFVVQCQVFALPIAFVTAINGGSAWPLACVLPLLVGTLALWWRDITRESTYQGYHTAPVSRGLMLAMGFFIASEVIFFFRLFWAFFHFTLRPRIGVGLT